MIPEDRKKERDMCKTDTISTHVTLMQLGNIMTLPTWISLRSCREVLLGSCFSWERERERRKEARCQCQRSISSYHRGDMNSKNETKRGLKGKTGSAYGEKRSVDTSNSRCIHVGRTFFGQVHVDTPAWDRQQTGARVHGLVQTARQVTSCFRPQNLQYLF